MHYNDKKKQEIKRNKKIGRDRKNAPRDVLYSSSQKK